MLMNTLTHGAAPVAVLERGRIAPTTYGQGTGLPFAGQIALGTAGGTMSGAVRKDDARVPIPRGRQL